MSNLLLRPGACRQGSRDPSGRLHRRVHGAVEVVYDGDKQDIGAGSSKEQERVAGEAHVLVDVVKRSRPRMNASSAKIIRKYTCWIDSLLDKHVHTHKYVPPSLRRT